MILFAEIVNPFCGKGQPFLWKRSTLFGKKVNLFWEKGQPFLRKRSTLFVEKVNLFWEKGQPFLWKRSTFFKKKVNFFAKTVRPLLKKQSSECNRAYTILAFNSFSFPLSKLCLIFLLFGFLTFASLIHLFTFFFFYLWISVLSRFFLLLLCTRDVKLIKTYE